MASFHLASQPSDERGRLCTSVKDLVRGFQEYDRLFEEIERHPQAGLFAHFGKIRAKCLSYLEADVYGRWDEVADMEGCIEKAGEEDVEAILKQQYSDKMNALIHSLFRHAQFFADTRNMLLSPPPSSYFADYFRSLLRKVRKANNGQRAPNGRSTDTYEEQGTTPVSQTHTALHSEQLNPIEELLAYKLMSPVRNFILASLEKLASCMTGRRRTYRGNDDHVEMRTIAAIAKAITCTLAMLFVTAIMVVLAIISDDKVKIAVFATLGLFFCAWAYYMGLESMPACMLIIGYVQAMSVNIGLSH